MTNTPQPMERLLRVPEVSEMTGISEDTLRHWRSRGEGPRSARLGRRIVYRESELRAWIEAQFAKADPRASVSVPWSGGVWGRTAGLRT